MEDLNKSKYAPWIALILIELRNAEKKFPTFPTDPLHAVAVVSEEAGELVRACLKWSYENGNMGDVEEEAIQTAAMALRFYFHLDNFLMKPQRSNQIITEEPVRRR